MSGTPNTHRVATTLAAALRELAGDAIPGCVLESVVLHGTYTDGRGGYAGNLRRTFGHADLRRQLADAPTSEAAVAKLREWVPDYEAGATHVAMPVATARKLRDRIEAAEAESAGLRDALNRERADSKRLERMLVEQYLLLEQARLAPGPTGLARAWSGYNDDECWFPAFADIRDAKAYAASAFRVSCAELDAGEPGEITWEERAARTDHLGYPDMWDLKSDVGGDGWVVCGLLVHPDLASGLREQPIEQPEPDNEPQPQIEGQGVLPVETAGSAT